MILAFAPQIQTAPAPALPSLNAAVVAYCQNRVGRKVGSGQCAELPQQALLSLGAMPRLKDSPNFGDYVWGRRIATLTSKTTGQAARVLPGDILQYRDVVFEYRTSTYWSQSSASHHTSVVASVRPGVLSVYEQNVNNRMTVGTTELKMADLKGGTLWVYRPELQAQRQRRR